MEYHDILSNHVGEIAHVILIGLACHTIAPGIDSFNQDNSQLLLLCLNLHKEKIFIFLSVTAFFLAL